IVSVAMKRIVLSAWDVSGLTPTGVVFAQQPAGGAPAPATPGHPTPAATPQPAAPQDPSQAPKLGLSETEWDFGTKWSGEPAEHEVVIRNDGAGPLKFRYQSSCGCTVAQPSSAQRIQEGEFQYQLGPGQSDKIKITYDTKKNRPEVLQTITITTNDPQQPKI